MNESNFFALQDIANQKIVLTIDACGLRGVTQKIFAENDYKINEYPGQATSYSVVEDWAKVGIGSGVLPYSKISSSNYARPLMVTDNENAEISCNLYFKSDKDYEEHIQQFINSIKDASL